MSNYPRFGDIFMYSSRRDGDSVKSGFRPVVVIRPVDPNENSESIVIAPVTSKYKQSCQINHVLLGKRFGLKKSSVILLEQMKWVNPDHLGLYVGHIAVHTQNRPQDHFSEVCDQYKENLHPGSLMRQIKGIQGYTGKRHCRSLWYV